MSKKIIIMTIEAFVAYALMAAIIGFILLPLLLASLGNTWATGIVSAAITLFSLYLSLTIITKNSKADLSTKGKVLIYTCVAAALFRGYGSLNSQKPAVVDIVGLIFALLAIGLVYFIVKKQILK